MRLLMSLIILSALTLAPGCAPIASAVGSVTQQFSTASPKQVTTLAAALAAAKLATDAVDLYVQTGNPDRATLMQLSALNDQVHTALSNLQKANAAGQGLLYASFNEALSAFRAYAALKGIASV